MGRRLLIFATVALAGRGLAQLPPSGALSNADQPLFEAEVAGVESLLKSAADRPTVLYAVARTWASAKQWPEAMVWLAKVADTKVGFDPSRDPMFAEIRGTTEFAALARRFQEGTAPVSHSARHMAISEGDLVPE